MAKPGTTGIKRIIKAFGFAWLGYIAAFKHEAAFRQELLAVIVMTPLAIIFAPGWLEMALLIGSLFLVVIVELLNSAIEAVVDRVGDDYHHLAGRAKDMAAAAVLTSILSAGAIWGIILIPAFIDYLNG